MKKLTGPIVGLHFMRHISVAIDTTHGLIHFLHLTMQVKKPSSQTGAKPPAVFIHDRITIPQKTRKTVTAFVEHLSDWYTTGTVTAVEKFTEIASFLISHSISTLFDRQVAVRVTNITESPSTINKNTQTIELSVVTQEQSKFNKPLDTAFLSMTPEGDPDLFDWATQNEQTRSPKQHFLVSDTQKSWQYRGSYLISNTRITAQFKHKS